MGASVVILEAGDGGADLDVRSRLQKSVKLFFVEKHLELNTADKKREAAILEIELHLSSASRFRNLEINLYNSCLRPILRMRRLELL